METLLNVLKWSAAVSAATLIVMAAKPLLDRRFSPKWRYWLWLVLAAALLLSPVRWENVLPAMPEPAVRVTVRPVRFSVGAEAPVTAPVPVYPPDAENAGLSSPAPSTPELPHMLTAAAPASGPQKTVELSAVLTALWLGGAAVFALWHILGTALLTHRARRWGVPAPKEVRELYMSVCARLGIRRPPALTVSRGVASPMAAGLLRPRLLLPDRDLPERELEFILRHELTHVKRRDLWYKALMLLANALHWFDPLVWLLRREANETVELLCDAQAMAGADEGTRREYCETLLSNIRREKGAALTTHFYGGVRSVKNRFKNLLTGKNRRFGWVSLIAGVLAVTIAACAVGFQGDGGDWLADLTSYDKAAALGEGFTVEAAGLASEAPEVSGDGGYKALTKLTVSPGELRFAIASGDRGEAVAWTGFLWNSARVDPVTGEERPEDAIEDLGLHLRIWMDGDELAAELATVETDGEAYEYVVKLLDPITDVQAENGTLFIAAGTEEWMLQSAYDSAGGEAGDVEPWSVKLTSAHVGCEPCPGLTVTVEWENGEPVIISGCCDHVDTPTLSDSGVSFVIYQQAEEAVSEEAASKSILPIRQYAEYDAYRDSGTANSRPENAQQLRAGLEKVFRVKLNGETVPGGLHVSGGNGHTDFTYVFDKPLERPSDGDTVFISVGTEEWNDMNEAQEGAPIDDATLAFWQERLNSPEWNGFVAQFYRSPAELDLYDLLYLGGGVSRSLTDAEAALYDDGVCPWYAFDVEAVDEMLRERTGYGLDTVSKSRWMFIEDGGALITAHGDTNYRQISVTGGEERGGIQIFTVNDAEGRLMGRLVVADGKIVSFTNPVHTALAGAQEEYLAGVREKFGEATGFDSFTEVTQAYMDTVIGALNSGSGRYVALWSYILIPYGHLDGADSLELPGIGRMEQSGAGVYGFKERDVNATVIDVDGNGYVSTLGTVTGDECSELETYEDIISHLLPPAPADR